MVKREDRIVCEMCLRADAENGFHGVVSVGRTDVVESVQAGRDVVDASTLCDLAELSPARERRRHHEL